jgi:hypothetical protein
VLSTGQQVGNAVGVAVPGLVFSGAADLSSDAQLAFSHAFSASVAALLVVELVLTGIVQFILRGPRG